MKARASALQTLFRVAAVAACLQLAGVGPLALTGQSAAAAPQSAVPATQPSGAPATAAQAPGRGPQPVDPRVQIFGFFARHAQ